MLRNFLSTVIKGFGWGLGFSIAFLSMIWMYQTYIGSPPQRVEYSWPDDEISNTEILKQKELEGLVLTVKDARMIEGRVIVSGKIENKIKRDALWLEVEARVNLDGEVIEICKSADRNRLNVGRELEFVIFCDSKWDGIKLKDIEVETNVSKASGYKNR